MLYKETVTPDALELLTKLMKDEELADFILVGGTALSLPVIPLKSITFFDDIDFNKPIRMINGSFN